MSDSANSPTNPSMEPRDDDLLLQRALDGELRPNERLELDARLADDPRLRARLDELEALRDFRLDARPRGGLGLDFADRVMARCDLANTTAAADRTADDTLATEASTTDEPIATSPEPLRVRSWLEKAIFAAAALLLALGGSFLLRTDSERAMEVEASPATKQEVRQLYEKFEERERRRRMDRELREREDKTPNAAGDGRAGR